MRVEAGRPWNPFVAEVPSLVTANVAPFCTVGLCSAVGAGTILFGLSGEGDAGHTKGGGGGGGIGSECVGGGAARENGN